jgi:proteasome accessory factor B
LIEAAGARPILERLLQIHKRIQAGEWPNCRQLAEEAEVSVRTIKRDLDFLKYRLRLPVEYDARRYGYYYTEAVEQFPSVMLTEAELFGMVVAEKALLQYRGTPFYSPLKTALRKLTGRLDQTTSYTVGNMESVLSFRPCGVEDPNLELFHQLVKASQQRQVVSFRYRNLAKQTALPRRVRPYHLAYIDNHWYLLGFDLKRQAIRTFALTRLTQLRVTGPRFAAAKGFNPDEYLQGSFRVFKGNDDYEVVVDLDAWATDLIRGRQWHASQDLIELPGGCARLRLRLNGIEEMEQWVLGWGTHATVVRPQALIERLRTTARALAARYEEPATDAR